jgi:hypothetical protein
METQTASVKKIAFNYGILLGIIYALLTTILYAISIMTLTKWWLGIIMFMVALAMGIVSIAKSKDVLGGYMSFKEAFTSYFITIATGLLISVIVTIIIFVVVDPSAAEYLNEEIIEISRSMMEKFGVPQADIEVELAKLAEKNSYAFGAQLQGYVIQLAFYSFFGLLVSLIFRKNDPNAIS